MLYTVAQDGWGNLLVGVINGVKPLRLTFVVEFMAGGEVREGAVSGTRS